LLHIRYVLPLLFGPFPEAWVAGGSALEFIDLAVYFFEALRLFNLVQTRQLVNIKINVFQGIVPPNKTGPMTGMITPPSDCPVNHNRLTRFFTLDERETAGY
jgi:hypothetical protein